MASPKKKISRSRRDMRRYSAANLLSKPTYGTCKNCGDLTRPHTVCSHCGHYDGKPVIAIRQRNKATQETETA